MSRASSALLLALLAVTACGPGYVSPVYTGASPVAPPATVAPYVPDTDPHSRYFVPVPLPHIGDGYCRLCPHPFHRHWRHHR